MTINCTTGMAPPSATFIKIMEPEYVGLAATCGVITLLVLILYMEQFTFLYIHLDKWKSRFHVMFLLSLYPVYSLMSMVTLFIPRSIPINDMATGVYISICLYVFVRLLIGHYGGKRFLMDKLVGTNMPLATPPICCCCFFLPVIKVEGWVVHVLEGLVLQYGIFRTITGYASAVVYTDLQSTYDINAVFSRGAFSILSTLLAMYGLQLLYLASLEPLKHIPLTAKFRCLQLVLIIDNVQRSILTTLGSLNVIPCAAGLNSELNAYRIHRMIATLEMLLLSIVARKFYRSHMEDIRKNLNPISLHRNESIRSTTQILPAGELEEAPDTEAQSNTVTLDVQLTEESNTDDMDNNHTTEYLGTEVDMAIDIPLSDDGQQEGHIPTAELHH